MPIYEYQCRECGHIWDELQKLSDPEPEFCPKCAQAAVSRKLTAAAFRLKGAGWYETDFKGDKDTKRNLVEAPDSGTDKSPPPVADGKAVDTGKSENKPSESKVDSKPTPVAESKAPAAPSAPAG